MRWKNAGLVLAIIGLVVLGGQIVAFADKAAAESSVVKIIELKIIVLAGEADRLKKPNQINNAKQLGKVITDNSERARISEQFDFDSQKLLYFRWSGSSGDKLSFVIKTTGKTNKVTFYYRMGAQDDVEQHAFLYAVDKGAICGFTVLK